MTHFLTRLNTKEAADKAGELPIQDGIIRLSLRTTKPTGLSIDAEHHKGKSDYSFASLAPGDTIEDQSVTISAPRSKGGGYQQIFYFQDSSPNLRSEFIIVAPKAMKPTYRSYNGAPEPRKVEEGDNIIYIWRRDNVPAQKPEPHSVHTREFTPFVVVSHAPYAGSGEEAKCWTVLWCVSGAFDITTAAQKLVKENDSVRRKRRKFSPGFCRR